jgi:hypothetical protein
MIVCSSNYRNRTPTKAPAQEDEVSSNKSVFAKLFSRKWEHKKQTKRIRKAHPDKVAAKSDRNHESLLAPFIHLTDSHLTTSSSLIDLIRPKKAPKSWPKKSQKLSLILKYSDKALLKREATHSKVLTLRTAYYNEPYEAATCQLRCAHIEVIIRDKDEG